MTTTTEAFKCVGVTDGVRHSVYVGTSAFNQGLLAIVPWQVYIPNQLTVRPAKCGPFACYKTKSAAIKRAREEFVNYTPKVEVWRAEILPSRDRGLWHEVVTRLYSFWTEWTLCEASGEIYADTVKLVELVESYGEEASSGD